MEPDGQRLHTELVNCGHHVTAIARTVGRIQPLERTEAVQGDIEASDAPAKILAGHDAVISAVMFRTFDPEKLLGTVIASGVPRSLVVGGAGGLQVAPGVRFLDIPNFPEAARGESEAGIAYHQRPRRTKGLDWTFPPRPAFLRLASGPTHSDLPPISCSSGQKAAASLMRISQSP
ncbi:NAD(P)-dependent oxidoreductase [Martelella mediterranea]|uniref:NAD(P)-dependent oxidoreductase n=1 Tax=Martelella mediterranea TaxID=293089 RepID=UPI002E1EA41F